MGHDWGAPVAWNSALLRPDMFRAVVGMSVPWDAASHVDVLSALEKLGIKTFYMQYFQRPGVAEAEFEKDIANTLRRIYFSGSRRCARAQHSSVCWTRAAAFSTRRSIRRNCRPG